MTRHPMPMVIACLVCLSNCVKGKIRAESPDPAWPLKFSSWQSPNRFRDDLRNTPSVSTQHTQHVAETPKSWISLRQLSTHAVERRNHLALKGSNFFFYSLGSFGTRFNHPPEQPWANASHIKLWNDCWYSLGDYAPDLGPQLIIQNIHQPDVLETVRAQLAQMKSEGQTAIAIPIWFGEPVTGSNSDISGHLFNWYRLTDQQKSNLLTFTDEIYAAGFLKITFRFNHNGTADPSQWNSWRQDSFLKCANFVTDCIALLRQSLVARFGSCGNRWSFDLGGELGGSVRGQSPTYTARLMKAYIDNGFSIDETCGFSMACGDKTIAQTFQNQYTTLSAMGPAYLPKSWAVTCYSRSGLKTNILEGLTSLATAMRQIGCQNQSVIILECLNNDAAEAAEINLAIDSNPSLNITELYQWPISRNALDNGVWTVDSACADAFANYRNIGRSTSPGEFNFEKTAITTQEKGLPGGRLTLKVLRTGGTIGRVQIPISTANGTATSGQDYVGSSQQLIFNEGQISATLALVILNDRLVEEPETFTVHLGRPSNPAASLGPGAKATITILSDESPPPPSRPIGGQTILAKGTLTGVKINFSYDLDPKSTANISSYTLYAPGKDGRFQTSDDIPLPILKSAYDSSHKVLIITCKPYKFNSDVRLCVSGTGPGTLVDRYKRPIDGDQNGIPGGDAVLLIHRNGSIEF